MSLIELFLIVLTIHVGIGVCFAVPFVFLGAGRLDDAARRGSPAFRLIIIPGAILLWPLLLAKVLLAKGIHA